MPKVSDLAVDRLTTDFLPYEDAPDESKVTFTFRPGLLTAEVTDHFDASRGGDDGPMLKFFAEAIIEWDLEDDDGKPFPIEVDSLKTLPSWFLLRLYGQMNTASLVPKAKPSDSGSS